MYELACMFICGLSFIITCIAAVLGLLEVSATALVITTFSLFFMMIDGNNSMHDVLQNKPIAKPNMYSPVDDQLDRNSKYIDQGGNKYV